MRYLSCNLNECDTKIDFRAEQCSKFNDKLFDEKYHKVLFFFC